MRKLLLTFIIALSAIGVNAKSMKELWASMPDSLMPTIDHTHRLEMTDFIGMGLKGDVDNLMGSKSVMDTITNNFIQLTLSESSIMQIKRLPIINGDSILCVVKTWKAPEKESSVAFYDEQWQKLDKKLNLNDYLSQLISRPDTMSEDSFSSLREDIDFTMVSASLNPKNDNLTLSVSIPNEDKQKAKRLKDIMVSKSLNWSDEKFM